MGWRYARFRRRSGHQDAHVLETGYGVLGEWSGCTLGMWENMMVTIDRITQPGVLKITVDRYFDFQVTRAARFAILKEA